MFLTCNYQPKTHQDNGASDLVVVWVARDPLVKGGFFVFPEIKSFFKLEDNMLFWFQNQAVHGTSLTEVLFTMNTPQRATMATARRTIGWPPTMFGQK